jgi:hypothetical protein
MLKPSQRLTSPSLSERSTEGAPSGTSALLGFAALVLPLPSVVRGTGCFDLTSLTLAAD